LLAPILETATVGRYTVYELNFDYPSEVYANQWDDPTLMVTFTALSGAQIVVGGFYFDVNTWKARFAPAEVGRYT